MNATLIGELAGVQRQSLELLGRLSHDEACTQYHPDLSPLAWHVGHMAFVESYWIREIVLGNDRQTAPFESLYRPELSPKAERGDRLRGQTDMGTRVAQEQRENIDLLADLLSGNRRHPLLENDYLAHFLVQHHGQHIETMHMVLQQRALAADCRGYQPGTVLEPRDPAPPRRHLPAGTTGIGHAGGPQPFDNELPRHDAAVDGFLIGAAPVSNAEYLGFIEAGGYGRSALWAPQGWAWLQAGGAQEPNHWRRTDDGRYYCIGPEGPGDLAPGEAVTGLSRHEAAAFAAYAGARLPEEREWEYAMSREPSLWASTGGAWEWCANAFFPYPGFRAFPYEGYSTPWFDGHHYTLRGAGPYTRRCLRRASFRNFYTADKRHVFAGLRLTASA
jgi:iron(II)-dependent oxidoreductase